jgi:tRNA A-37 threonylcarbamoyl transferase component Bud32
MWARSLLLHLHRERPMDAVGGYQLVGRVSENRPSSVWKGRHPASARSVALKQVELTTNDTIMRLRAQTRVLAGISHPALVEVLELIEGDQHAWLVEDWVDGVSVSALLDAGGAFSPVEAVAIVCDALAGLAHVHQRAIVHGNLAAGSFLVAATGTLKLTDFGATSLPSAGWPITLQSDVRDTARVLRSLLPSVPKRIEAVLQSAQVPESERCYRSAVEFRRALIEAADVEFGPGWREQVDLVDCVRRTPIGAAMLAHDGELELVPVASLLSSAGSAPTSEPDARIGTALHPSEHRVKVRSPKRAARPAEKVAEVRDYLEPRTPRAPGTDGNAGRFIPIVATVVVVVAIVVLVVTHHDMKKSTPAGLAFHGSYDVTTTFSSAGVGVDQGQSIASTRSDKWQVTSTCSPAKTCAASVTPSSGAVFTLSLDGQVWSGEQSMPTSNSCVGVYSYTLKSPTSADSALAGTVVGRAVDCGRSGTETASLALIRTTG